MIKNIVLSIIYGIISYLLLMKFNIVEKIA